VPVPIFEFAGSVNSAITTPEIAMSPLCVLRLAALRAPAQDDGSFSRAK
jgi:hypothetical protein